jgi:hypothetical protein
VTGYSRPASNEPAPPDRLRLWLVPDRGKLSQDARECFPLPRARSFNCEHSSSDPWLYRIRIDGKCWTATRLQGYTYPRHLHSCARLRDQIRLWSWLDY